MDLEPKDDPRKTSLKPSFADQHLLVNFIMGNYLGPGILSVSKDSGKFASVYVSVSLLESLHYHLLRNAHPSLIMRPEILHEYLKGSPPLPSSGAAKESWRQFTELFPLDLHEQIWYPESFRVVKGIVLVDDPVTLFMEDTVLEKFKSLSGINGLEN